MPGCSIEADLQKYITQLPLLAVSWQAEVHGALNQMPHNNAPQPTASGGD